MEGQASSACRSAIDGDLANRSLAEIIAAVAALNPAKQQ